MTRMAVVLAAVGALALSAMYLVRPANATQGDPHKVIICHRTDSEKNPYVRIDVDVASVDGDAGNDHGKGDHLLEHTGAVWAGPDTPKEPKWGDIIPPFYDDGVTPTGYPSLNWNDAGKAIFDNGCNPVTEQSVAESVAQSIEQSVAQSAEQSVAQSVEQSVAESVAQSAEQSVAESVAQSAEQSVAESVAQSAEGSVDAGTGTPAGSQPNTALGDSGVNPLPTVAFSLILLGSLGALAYANVKGARS
jgi:hypothetical protein